MDPDEPTDLGLGASSDPAENRRRLDEWLDDFVDRHRAMALPAPAKLSCPPAIPDGLAEGAWSTSTPDEPPAGMDPDLWPEDVLSDEEWMRGWFGRKVVAGELDATDAPTIPEVVGGTMPTPPGPWSVGTKRPPRRRR